MTKKLFDKITEAVMPSSPKQPHYNTGLVLSGGAVRGFAHLGVIKALEENRIKPEIISGVSAGAIVGGFIASGYTPEETLDIFVESKIFNLVKLYFNKQGLFDITGLKKVLKKHLTVKNIEDLHVPLFIAATNINKGAIRYFSKGNLIDVVLASSSIPVIFKPTIIKGQTYVDGGVLNNFPIEPLKERCNELIGVHVNPVGGGDPNKGLLHIAMQSFHLSIASGIEEKKKLLKYFIEPKELSKFNYYDIKKGSEMYEIGYTETLKVVNKVSST